MIIDKFLMDQLLEAEKRTDKRKMDEYRKVTIEKDVVSSAEGSARVKIGDTEVIAGIKLDIGTPYPDRKDEGNLMVNAEFLPLASANFESGPPSDESIELARVVDRAIRESKCLDMKKLCIEKGVKVWMVNIDIDILNHDGNLIDAANLAAITALKTAKMPKLVKQGDDYEIDYTEKKGELPLSCIPVSTTFVKIGKKIITDPSGLEETAMDARLTIGTFEDGKNIMYSSIQKGGLVGITLEELDQMLEMAAEKGKELRKRVK
jgi:exosome complex component RRP42